MGTIFESVKDQPDVCMADAHAVMASFVQMMTAVGGDGQPAAMDEADPQVIAIMSAIP